MKNVEITSPNEENLIELDDDAEILSPPDIEDKPGELYFEALDSIPLQYFDDGMFGLNVETGEIGNNTFSVTGNVLTTKNINTINRFEINDLELWQLLLVKRPNAINLSLRDRHGRDILNEYKTIASTLDLVQDVKYKGMPYQNRAKYKILMTRKKDLVSCLALHPHRLYFILQPL